MTQQAPERRAYTPQEFAYAINLGESKTRELYQSGRVRCVRVGRRILIPATEIARFLETGGESTTTTSHDQNPR